MTARKPAKTAAMKSAAKAAASSDAPKAEAPAPVVVHSGVSFFDIVIVIVLLLVWLL